MSNSGISKECLGYEKELEGYLFDYKSGEMVNIPLLQNLYRRCNNPSPKFEMIYYYFLAVDAYHTDEFTDEEAYDRASDFYERSAAFFSEFNWNSKERFIQNFYTRAEGLEVVLTDLAYDLGYDGRRRYIQSSYIANGSPWKKSNIVRFSNSIAASDRGQRQLDERPGTFSKSYRDGDEYKPYPNFVPNPNYDKDGEPYGFVGNISEVNPIGYLAYLGEHSQNNDQEYLYTYSDEKEAALASNARYSRGNYSQSRGQDQPLAEGDYIGINDRIALADRPGASSSTGDYLGFGEYAYRVSSERPVSNGGKTFLKVEVAGGKTGWIPAEKIVEKGKLAVLLENTRGIPRINIRSNDRNAILFKAGELVVLQDYREGMVKAVNRNGTKSAWIKDVSNLSIEEEDIQIASLLHVALSNYTNRDLRSQLEAIKYVPGYPESPLSRIVEDNIRLLNR